MNVLPNEAGNAGGGRSAVGNVDDHQRGAGIVSVSLREWEIVSVSQNATWSAIVFWNEVNASVPGGDVAPRLSERDRYAVSSPLAVPLSEPVGARLDSACEVLLVPVSRTQPTPSHSARCRVSQETKLLWFFSRVIYRQWVMQRFLPHQLPPPHDESRIQTTS